MSQEIDIKITGWEHKGLKIPDWKIDLDDSKNQKFSLILIQSGMGKTTTLQLLRYSFFDYSNIISKEDINKLKSPNNNTGEGDFTLFLKINNTKKARIEILFNFKKLTMSYKTTGISDKGTVPGLLLPDQLKKYIDQDFIEKAFFDFELAELLFTSNEAIESIKKLCKTNYLELMRERLQKYLEQEQEEKESIKLSNIELKELKIKRDLINKNKKELVEKFNKLKIQKYNLEKNKKDLEKDKKKIIDSKKEIANEIKKVEYNFSKAEQAHKLAYEKAFDELKDSMNLHQNFKNTLNNFVNNLDKLKIPKSVGEAFFDDLIKEPECLCGHKMDKQMIEQIMLNKKNILSEDTWLILSVLKTKVRTNKSKTKEQVSETFGDIIKKKREYNIADLKRSDIIDNIDDTRLNEINKDILEIDSKLEEIESFIELYNKKPEDEDDPFDQSFKSLEVQLEKVKEKITNATETKETSDKVEFLNTCFVEIEKQALNEIVKELVKKINLQIPRVMPDEKIYIEDIKNKIVLKDRKGASRGQLARIGYLFLVTLLSRPELKFPFIVDSPVTAMDDTSRQEIGVTLADDLKSQFIAFLLTTEREDFADTLDKKLNENINLVTAFSTLEEDSQRYVQQAKKAGIKKNEFNNGVVSYDKNFFYNLKDTRKI